MIRFPLFHAFSCSLLALASQALGWQTSGESVPAVPQEFRAAWISTVHNIDWPSRSGLSGAAQRAELLNILNTCAQLKLNAVFLQVRPNADALYRSSLEPWSQWLSGPGVNPGYDPLAFAIQEAHRRGIELHAWFNPFRAKANVKHAVGRNHISLTRPDLMKRNGSVLLMNPSASASRDHALKVIMDVVRRYDIDGVHLDDYFYPYPTPGRAWSPASFGDGKSPSQRRGYIDDFVQDMYKSVKSSKPWVRVGVSPFGIWRPGVPGGIEAGVDAYEHLACDARKWLSRGWVDYLAPQLYWRCSPAKQSFPALMQWWAAQNSRRPVWPGIATARIMSSEDPGRPASEIAAQVNYSGRFGGETAFLKKRKAFRDPKFVPRRYMFRGLARLSWPMPECVLLVLRASVQIVCKSRDGVTYRVEVLFPILLCRWPITDIRGVLSSSRSFLSNR